MSALRIRWPWAVGRSADRGATSVHRLVVGRFTRQPIASVALGLLLTAYFIAAFAEFIAPYDPHERSPSHVYAPPQVVRFLDGEGRFHLRPFAHPWTSVVDADTFRRQYSPDRSVRLELGWFVRTEPYRMWGVWTLDRKLFGPVDASAGRFMPLGADASGRDQLSRIIHGARVSLTLGLLGVSISLVLGLVIGGVSGYLGGLVDDVVQRVIEVVHAVPFVPLWMALSAAVPPHWPQLRTYFAITLILSLAGWVSLARVVRGKFLALREEEYVLAARTSGCSTWRIVTRHMLPSFTSHVIAVVTLAVPGMILGETALSFLGLGLRPPLISWGVLLQQAQNVTTVALYPWLLWPAASIIVVILAFNFVGDGLRDAADPYAS